MAKKYHPVFFDIETTGLNPMAESWMNGVDYDAEVVCVGIGTVTNWRDSLSGSNISITIFDHEQEYELIRNFNSNLIDWLDQKTEKEVGPDDEYFFVGWNNRSYDHTYYGARAARLRLNGYPVTHGWKRLDCQRVIKKMTGRYWAQDDWMDEIGVAHEDDITGADVPDLYSQNRVGKIRKHCRADVHDLIEIFLNNREKMMNELYSHYDDIRRLDYKEPIDL